jgi:hypothetical protein
VDNQPAIVAHLRTSKLFKHTLSDGRPLEERCATLNKVMRAQRLELSLCLVRTISGESSLYRGTARPVLVFDLGYTDILDQLTYLSVLAPPGHPMPSPDMIEETINGSSEYTDVPAKVFILRTLAEALLSFGCPHEALLCLATAVDSNSSGCRVFTKGGLARAHAISQVQHLFILLHEIAHYRRAQEPDSFRGYEWLATTCVTKVSEMLSDAPMRLLVPLPDDITPDVAAKAAAAQAVRAMQDLSSEQSLIELQCDMFALTSLQEHLHLTGVRDDDDLVALHTLRLGMATVSEVRRAARDYARGVRLPLQHEFVDSVYGRWLALKCFGRLRFQDFAAPERARLDAYADRSDALFATILSSWYTKVSRPATIALSWFFRSDPRRAARNMYHGGISDNNAFAQCMRLLGCEEQKYGDIQIDGHSYRSS